MGRKLLCTLDKTHADFTGKIEMKQQNQKEYHDQHAKSHYFHIGDHVCTRNFGYGLKGVHGVIQDITGPVSYTVTLGNAQIVRHHVDQLYSHQQKERITDYQQSMDVQLHEADVVSQDTEVQVPKLPSTFIIPTLGVTPEKKELENVQTECSSWLLPGLFNTPTIPEVTSIAEVKNPEIVPTGGLRLS